VPVFLQSLTELQTTVSGDTEATIFWDVMSRAVAQAVRRWLPNAAARVRVRAACGVCGGQSGTGAGFLRVLLPIILPISASS
jgi:hypothetical protein